MKKENMEKNMEFLIKELQNEWNITKESRHTVRISVKYASKIRSRIQRYITDIEDTLRRDGSITFKNSMKLCKESYVTLRVARKLITELDKVGNDGYGECRITFDKEEFRCYRKLASEKDESLSYM